MTGFLASVPWQVWALLIVAAGTTVAIVWEESGRRLAQVADLDDPVFEPYDGDWEGL